MAYTLKSTGIATNLKMCLAIDQDGTTCKEFVSPTVDAAKTVSGSVVISSSTWKGASRGYFETKPDGTFDYFGVRFGATKPSVDLGAGHPASVFIAASGAAEGGGLSKGFIQLAAAPDVLVMRSGTDKFASGLGNGTAGSTSLPTDNTTKFSVGYVHNQSGTERYFYGLESGSLATDGTGADDGRGADGATIFGVGGTSGSGNQPGKYHIMAIFNKELSTAEFQSLHDDWFGTLFDISGGTALDEEGEWIIPVQSW